MKKSLFSILLLTVAVTLFSSPLKSKLKHSIIVDSDCNESDLRAISILLSNPGITVKAILVSDGKLRREEGIKKIRNLLHRFNADTIQVTTGTGMAEKFRVSEILQASKEQMTIVCLGPLTNIVSELYIYDARQILDSAIMRYGIDEWKACVMKDEFHGHLGVFSIVGAKMGIYAREYFGIGTDLLEINTYAGSKEPLSCMNDGLQVSTGATLGQGSIHLINDTIAKPQAVFTYQNRSIMIKLKSSYLKELKSVIDEEVKN